MEGGSVPDVDTTACRYELHGHHGVRRQVQPGNGSDPNRAFKGGNNGKARTDHNLQGLDGGAAAKETNNGFRQCAPDKRSPAEVSATNNRSTAQVQRGAGHQVSVPRKKKITPKNTAAISRETVRTSLQEFRVIYRSLLKEKRNKGLGIRHDLAAFQVFRESFCAAAGCDDRRYVGSLPGVEVGDVFDSNMDLFLVGLHRSLQSSVDYDYTKDAWS
jgi:hypothetical protein